MPRRRDGENGAEKNQAKIAVDHNKRKRSLLARLGEANFQPFLKKLSRMSFKAEQAQNRE